MAFRRTCDYCHREIPKKEVLFNLKLEMFAAAEFPDDFAENLDRDHQAEIDALLEIMEQMDVQEAMDEVFESYLFRLCTKCRNAIHRKLKEHGDKKQII